MPVTQFDRDTIARWYAKEHLKTDPGVRSIYYLPANAPDREIRLVEVNELIAERDGGDLEPIDFGADVGTETEHRLLVLDVTPAQWERVQESTLPLPEGWTLEGAVSYRRE